MSATTVTVDWKTLLAEFNTQVSAGVTRWDENTINTFVSSAINSGSLALPKITELNPALHSAINSYFKQELFVAIYSENGDTPLTWAPKLRFKNVDQPSTQQIAIRYFDSDLLIKSSIDLSCLTKPDEQNNIYKSSICASDTTQ